MKRLLTVAFASLLSPACLVLSLNPSYDEDTIGWDPALLGSWQDADDRSSMEIDGGEWKSYRIKYAHPIENGTVTAYLTAIGDDRFLDVMPARGEDRGSFLIPVHAMVRMQLDGDRLELTPVSYDWVSERVRSRTRIPGLHVTLDQKENALIASATAELRAWVRKQPRDGPMFGAPATFHRRSAIARATPLMLKGSKPAVVKKIQPVSIHGQISLDVYFVDPDDQEGQVSLARVGPEALPRALEPGDSVDLHYLVGVVTKITRRVP